MPSHHRHSGDGEKRPAPNVAATRQGLEAWMLPDLVVELAGRGGIALTVAEVILRTIRARYRVGVIEQSLARLQQLYRRFEGGEISLGFFAQELGLGVRDLYAALERRGLPTTNIGARQPTTGE